MQDDIRGAQGSKDPAQMHIRSRYSKKQGGMCMRNSPHVLPLKCILKNVCLE